MSRAPGAAWSTTLIPIAQVAIAAWRRLQAVGHPTDKIELLILGGTWSAYRRDYQEWFVRRCFDAMNGVELASSGRSAGCNETASSRNVGLVIETRPDDINPCRAGLAAPPGRDQGADGRAEPG